MDVREVVVKRLSGRVTVEGPSFRQLGTVDGGAVKSRFCETAARGIVAGRKGEVTRGAKNMKATTMSRKKRDENPKESVDW